MSGVIVKKNIYAISTGVLLLAFFSVCFFKLNALKAEGLAYESLEEDNDSQANVASIESVKENMPVESSDYSALIYDDFSSLEESSVSQSDSNVEFIDAGAAEKTEITFSYGFRNIAKSGRMLPFVAEITNHTQDDIEAELLIRFQAEAITDAGRYEPEEIEYSYRISLPAEETVDIRNTISVPSETNPITFSVYDLNGNLLCEGQTAITLQNPDESSLLIGILSNAPENLEYLNGISISGTNLRTRTVELDAQAVPENASGLEQLDMLVISNYDISLLKAEQIQVVTDWVKSGGVLLLGTGSNVNIVSAFSNELGGLSIGSPTSSEVNMGLRYSRTGPDGATLELTVCNVFLPEGTLLMESDDLSLLTAIQTGNGLIGITAYDLVDISGFCNTVPEYAEDLITYTLGTSRLVNMDSDSNDTNALYNKAWNLLGMVDSERLPGVMGYVLMGVIYIFAAGIGIYLYLKRHDLSIYLTVALPIVSFAGAIAIWLLNSAYNNNGINLNFALIREFGTQSTSNTGFISMDSSQLNSYEIYFPSDCELHPVPQQADTNQNGLTNAEKDESREQNDSLALDVAKVSVSHEDDFVTSSTENIKPFVPSVQEYFLREQDTADYISAEINCFEGHLSGTLVNESSYLLEDVAILMYGRLVKLGDMEPGETIALENMTVLNIPVGNLESVADYITQADSLSFNDAGYAKAMRQAALLSYYMEDSMKGYFSDARLISFSDDSSYFAGLITTESNLEISGSTLFTSITDVTNENNGYYWTNCMETEPLIVTGSYDVVNNTTTGSCILEYSLGNDLRVIRLGFSSVSDYFLGSSDSAPFSGTVSLYNYEIGGYELFDYLTDSLNETELKPYLSPGNTVTVRFNSYDEASGSNLYLPLPDVTGVMER